MYNIAKKYLLLGLSLSLLVVAATFFFSQKETTAPQTEIATKKQTKLTHIKYEGAIAVSEEVDNINDLIVELDTLETAGTFSLTAMAQSITEEALKAFSNSDEHSLPLVSHWNVGIPELTDAMNPIYMIDRIEQGEHILVSWKLDPYYADTIGNSYYEESIKKAAELQLPLVFILPAPESALTIDSYYKNLPREDNPNVVDQSNDILDKLSPFGPDEQWNDVGNQWSTTTLMIQLQEWYPNPPLVIFISEDEAAMLSWNELASSSRFLEHYQSNNDDNYKRTLVGGKWIEKYRQMQNGFKEGFTESAWKNNTKFISYNKLSDNFGKSADWVDNATVTNQYINVWPLTTDGVTVDFDLTGSKSDVTADAPHVLVNNLDFMLKEAKRGNSNFAYQLSLDGDSKITDPTRYRGLTQFALWFLRPNIIRQKSSATTRAELEPMFKEVVDSVELIHYNTQVAEFWKNGELVRSDDSYLNENIPEQYQNNPRWFLLNADENPNRPWSDSTNIKVWAFTIVKGEAPNREWLIYAQSPESDISNVAIEIPDYRNIFVDTSVDGSFYILSENNTPVVVNSTDEDSSSGTVPTMDISKSSYLETVNIPECNAGNPEVQFIENDSDWSHINDANKSIFCISPGDYISAGPIEITTSGTEDNKKFILLNNGNDIHPGKLNRDNLARVEFYLRDANFWVIDRMADWENPTTDHPITIDHSSYNVINRYFMENVGNGIYLYTGSHNNTIQNCRIQRDDISIYHDRAAIGLQIKGVRDGETKIISNTKVINNEVYNFVDGFQTIKQRGDVNINYEGTIVDGNHFYIDNTIYTDCQGNKDINGDCAYAENGMDLKAGSHNPNNPMIITNNKMWGFRKADETNSYLSDPGAVLPIHYTVNNTIIENNLAFDSARGIPIGAPTTDTVYAMQDSRIVNNIFYNIQGYGIFMSPIKNVLIDKNIFKYLDEKDSSASATWFWLESYNTIDCTISNNIAIDPYNRSVKFAHNIEDNNFYENKYYGALRGDIPENGGTVFQTDPTLGYDDFVFTTDNFTNNPREIRLPAVIISQ